MNSLSCETCILKGSKQCDKITLCDNWDGDCEICFLAGKPILKELCADCDWEDDEEENETN